MFGNDDPNPEALAELLAIQRELRRRDGASYIPQDPTPRQAMFLAAESLEALYGGAAGGGKSSALLMAALQYVNVPGYSALLLRRTYADLALPGAIMTRSHEWLAGSDAEWNGTDKRWTFPSGATLSFGYLDTERDRYRYQGAELQFIGFDELTQFPEQWYRYLLSRLRRVSGIEAPLRARAASNPGGIGHDWVRRRFVDPGDPQRVYVPATLADNPHLNQDEYRRSLAELDPTTRKQLLEGVWVRDSGGLVYTYDGTTRPIPKHRPGWSYVLGIDFGFVDATAWAVLGWAPNDKTVHVLESFKRVGLSPSDAGEVTHALCARYAFDRIVGDEGGLGKGYAEELRRRFHIPIEPADKRNKRGFIDLLNGDLRAGRLVVCNGNDELIKEWLELPWDEQRRAESPGFENHLCLIGDTMVSTPSGQVTIASIRVGDVVDTRRGPRRVSHAWCTGIRELWRLETTDGRTLVGTANHPVFTEENGMVRLDALLYGHTLLTCESQKLSCSMGSGSVGTPNPLGRNCETTSRVSVGGAFMWLFGKLRTALSRKGSTSITATGIPSTTTWATLSASTGENISASTCGDLRWLPSHEKALSRHRQPPPNGIVPKLGAYGMPSMGRHHGSGEALTATSASCVAEDSRHEQPRLPSALTSALPNSAATAVWTISTRFAQSAPERSAPTGTASRSAAPCRVRRVSKTGFVAHVYDLTVEGEHEFFANGILVSNSDATLYAWRAATAYAEPAPPVPKPVEEELLEERIESLKHAESDWWA